MVLSRRQPNCGAVTWCMRASSSPNVECAPSRRRPLSSTYSRTRKPAAPSTPEHMGRGTRIVSVPAISTSPSASAANMSAREAAFVLTKQRRPGPASTYAELMQPPPTLRGSAAEKSSPVAAVMCLQTAGQNTTGTHGGIILCGRSSRIPPRSFRPECCRGASR